MVSTTSENVTTVDLTAIERSDTRRRLLVELRTIEPSILEDQSFWRTFDGGQDSRACGRPLVLADLAPMVNAFRTHQPLAWTTAVRRVRPWFVAFVRTDQDRACVAWVDDLLRASDLRVHLCNDADDWKTVARCLHDAVSSLQPDTVIDVRYLVDLDRLWVEFGDGLTGTLEWSALGIESLRPTLVAESASPGEFGKSIDLLETNGDLFEIDAAAARSVLDEVTRTRLEIETADADRSLGTLLRTHRKHAGLTQVTLGEKSGMDQAVISRIESGRSRPTIDTLRRLAQAMNTTVVGLLG